MLPGAHSWDQTAKADRSTVAVAAIATRHPENGEIEKAEEGLVVVLIVAASQTLQVVMESGPLNNQLYMSQQRGDLTCRVCNT